MGLNSEAKPAEYKQILRVIAALANQDERIVEQFQVLFSKLISLKRIRQRWWSFRLSVCVEIREQLRQQIEISISNFVSRG